MYARRLVLHSAYLGLLDESHDLLQGGGFSDAGDPRVHQALAAHLGNKQTNQTRSKHDEQRTSNCGGKSSVFFAAEKKKVKGGNHKGMNRFHPPNRTDSNSEPESESANRDDVFYRQNIGKQKNRADLHGRVIPGRIGSLTRIVKQGIQNKDIIHTPDSPKISDTCKKYT